MGQFEDAVDYSRRALTIATTLRDRFLTVLASSRLCLAYVDQGDYRRAIEVGRECIAALSGDLVRELFEMAALPAVSVRVYIASSLGSLGDFSAAAAVADEALQIATAADHPYSMTLALGAQGRWRVYRGDFNEAIPWLERCLASCRQENFYFFNRAATITGGAYAAAGRTTEGIALLEEALSRGSVIQLKTYSARTVTTLADAYLAAGRLEDVFRTACEALERSRAAKHRPMEAEAHYTLGEIRARQDPPNRAGAEESYQAALALTTEIGMRPLAARCHLGLGRMHRAASQGEATDAHLTTARRMFAEMEMGFWLAQADAELKGSSVS